ncbi:uncharacterized protein LOC142346292 [Convolutriloba macropyga]|uniref:uncharacterized protein LOC142346292 n=1 Tax=Convolutriloba macropyga TaxID=536237 RepID=UPI003F520CB5
MDVYEKPCHIKLQTWTDLEDFKGEEDMFMCMDAYDTCTLKGDEGNPIVLVKDETDVCLAGINLFTNDKCYESKGRHVAIKGQYLEGIIVDVKDTMGNKKTEEYQLVENNLRKMKKEE